MNASFLVDSISSGSDCIGRTDGVLRSKGIELLPDILKSVRDLLRKDLRNAALCLMPSVSEPFGLVGLEAVAAGVLAIVPNNSGLGIFLCEHLSSSDLENVVIDNTGGNEEKVARWSAAISYWLAQPEAIGKRVK